MLISISFFLLFIPHCLTAYDYNTHEPLYLLHKDSGEFIGYTTSDNDIMDNILSLPQSFIYLDAIWSIYAKRATPLIMDLAEQGYYSMNNISHPYRY